MQNKRIDEKNCPCCEKPWSFNKIIGIKNEVYPTKSRFGFVSDFKPFFDLTYLLKCNECNIETKYYKSVLRDEFKQQCSTTKLIKSDV